MKNFLQILTLALAFSIAVTIYFANPFIENAQAEGGCWAGCDNGQSSPGDRSGCRVYYEGTVLPGSTIGYYRYECPNGTVTCAYSYDGADCAKTPSDS